MERAEKWLKDPVLHVDGLLIVVPAKFVEVIRMCYQPIAWKAKDMPKHGVQPDDVTYSTVVLACKREIVLDSCIGF